MKIYFKRIILFLAMICGIFYFRQDKSAAIAVNKTQTQALPVIPAGEAMKVESREQIKKQLEEKIRKGKPLVVHIFVPLCDNDHQGIVPVNAQLGDGQNLRTNLYWGAGYGVKSYFKLKTDWKLCTSISDPHPDILERVVFYKKLSNGSQVYLVADAFRGDRMKQSLHAFFGSLSGIKKDSVQVNPSLRLRAASDADLLIFNGHDGLMDDTLTPYLNMDKKAKDVMIIACYSHSFFTPHLEMSGGYPLITTTGLLAPEAYAMHAAIENWALLKTDNEIRLATGDAYYAKHPSSTQGGCRGLFKTGW
jgi:hypothetical protein